ncbi:MAG: DUF362 domain-containing protein, partial [Nitrospirae bacterium]|nr:DUF362 domain-containing protein [Nitrospirota bacterium]
YTKLKKDIFEIINNLDNNLIQTGSIVLIKPNLLAPSKIEQAITTHPLIIKIVCEYVLDKGGIAIISESPAMGKFKKNMKDCGVMDAINGMDIKIKDFIESREISVDSSINKIEIAQDVFDADVIINLPKLKTHSQMMLTLAVKNLFGCVIGLKKPEWHFKIGENRTVFAELLFEIYKAIKPKINLIDGILVMEGRGPGTGGTPRRLGILMGCSDALSLDRAVCDMLSVSHDFLLTNKVGKACGYNEEIIINGNMPKINDFKFPPKGDITFGPAFTRSFLRRNLTKRPATLNEKCKLCGECLKICPANAITLGTTEKRLKFDYDKCIRCYCCLEVCPHSAINIDKPWLGRVINKIGSKFIG